MFEIVFHAFRDHVPNCLNIDLRVTRGVSMSEMYYFGAYFPLAPGLSLVCLRVHVLQAM